MTTFQGRFGRLAAAAILAMTMALTPSFVASDIAIAQGSGSGSGGGVKTCKAKMANGKMKTWRCQRNQACCVNKATGTVSCGLAGMGCM